MTVARPDVLAACGRCRVREGDAPHSPPGVLAPSKRAPVQAPAYRIGGESKAGGDLGDGEHVTGRVSCESRIS